MAALNGDPVTESSGLWILVGADPEIHLADALARHLLEGAEHPAGAHGRLQFFIGHLAVAAIAEFEERLNGIAAGVAGIGGEKQLETALGLIHHEIGVPVGAADGFADQPLGTLHLLFQNRVAAAHRGQKAAAGLGLERNDQQAQGGQNSNGSQGNEINSV